MRSPADLKVEQSIASTRYVAPARPLSERHRARVFVLREGALDYRNIPSVMGNLSVPHGTKVVA